MKEEKRFASLDAQFALDAIPFSLVVLDDCGVILTRNSAWRNFWQANGGNSTYYEQPINYLKVCDEATHTESNSALAMAAGIRSVMQGREAKFELEYRLDSPTEKRHFLATVTRYDVNGKIHFLISHQDISCYRNLDGELSFRSITLEKRSADLVHSNSQPALHNRRTGSDSEQFVRTLLRELPSLVWAKDTEGVYLFCNTRVELLFGASEVNIVGKTDHELVDKAIADIFRNDDLAAMRTTIPFRTEEWVTFASDGHRELMQTTKMSIRDAKGHVIGLLGIAHDVTERAHLVQVLEFKNAELEAARLEAERANLAKSNFLSSMSHELRTPLNSILGFAQLIELGEPPPTPEQKRKLDQVLKSGWYLLELIGEILDLGKIESGAVSIALEPVSLKEIMLECETMIEPLAKQRKINMEFSQCTFSCVVCIDLNRTKQCMLNLLSNAIKYTDQGGSVFVQCTQTIPNFVRISVRDTGMGLTPKQIEQLFQPFNRLGRESGSVPGTGIGLVVTKRLIEQMSGAVGVESILGEGSTFWMDLPLTAAMSEIAAV